MTQHSFFSLRSCALCMTGVMTAVTTVGAGSAMAQSSSGGSAAGSAVGQASEIAAASGSAKEILANAIKAMGGRKAVEDLRSMRTKMELTTPMGVITQESFWSDRDDRVFILQTLPIGEMQTGFDGTVGWQSNPMGGGFTLLNEEQIDQARQQAAMHVRLLNIQETMKDEYDAIEAVGMADFDGRPCNKVRVESSGAKGGEPEKGFVFFDAKTNLPAGFEMIADRPTGPASQTLFLRDWKKEGDLSFFRSMVMSAQGQEINAVFTEIELNKVEPAVFRPPAEVTAMAASAGSATTRPAGAKKKLEDFSAQQQQMIKSMMTGFDAITDVNQLKMILGQLKSAPSMPGDQGEAMQYVIEALEEKIAALGG